MLIGETTTDPNVAPPVLNSELVQLPALVLDQVSSDELPKETLVGFAVKDTVGSALGIGVGAGDIVGVGVGVGEGTGCGDEGGGEVGTPLSNISLSFANISLSFARVCGPTKPNPVVCGVPPETMLYFI